MTKQIAVRLPDELVDYIDSAVRSGHARSRADLVSRALDRERRQAMAERDVEILRSASADRDEFDGLAEYAVRQPLDHLDR